MDTAVLERPAAADAQGDTPAQPAPLLPRVRVQRSMRRGALALGFGIAGSIISFIGSWNPSFWGDEAASVLSASRSLPSLFSLLRNMDAVHGAYYLLLHFWIGVFGDSELSVRLPSVIAAGLVAAGTVVLADRLYDRNTAVVSGSMVAVLPQLTHMGVEARSYALAMAAAVWLTVLLVRNLDRGTHRLRVWYLYGVVLAIGIYLFLYLGLIVLAHAAFVAARRSRREMFEWLRGAALGLVLAAPIIVIATEQHRQVAFLAERHYVTLKHVFVSQWFGTLPLAIVAWALILLAVTIGLVRRDRRIALLAGWLLLPVTVILATDALVAPTYNMRYLAFCVPAAAMLMARGLLALRFRAISVIGMVLVVAFAMPSYLHQRGAHGKDGGADFRDVAALVHEHAATGDAVVFSDQTKPSRRTRLALDLYPADFAGLNDVALLTPYAQRSGLWDLVAPVQELEPALDSTPTVWAIEKRGTKKPIDIVTLKAFGFHVVAKFHTHRETIYELSRGAN